MGWHSAHVEFLDPLHCKSQGNQDIVQHLCRSFLKVSECQVHSPEPYPHFRLTEKPGWKFRFFINRSGGEKFKAWRWPLQSHSPSLKGQNWYNWGQMGENCGKFPTRQSLLAFSFLPISRCKGSRLRQELLTTPQLPPALLFLGSVIGQAHSSLYLITLHRLGASCSYCFMV